MELLCILCVPVAVLCSKHFACGDHFVVTDSSLSLCVFCISRWLLSISIPIPGMMPCSAWTIPTRIVVACEILSMSLYDPCTLVVLQDFSSVILCCISSFCCFAVAVRSSGGVKKGQCRLKGDPFRPHRRAAAAAAARAQALQRHRSFQAAVPNVRSHLSICKVVGSEAQPGTAA
jgi:hypothetical protein